MNIVYLTQKIRIFPTQVQSHLLWILSEKCRLIYNFALCERIKKWETNQEKLEENRTYITYKVQQNKLPLLKKKYPEYTWVYSKVLQATLRKLDSNFKSFYGLKKGGDEKARIPKYKGKKYFMTLSYNQSGFHLKGNRISLSHKHPSKTELLFI